MDQLSKKVLSSWHHLLVTAIVYVIKNTTEKTLQYNRNFN